MKGWNGAACAYVVAGLALTLLHTRATGHDLLCDIIPSTGTSLPHQSLDLAIEDAVCDWSANVYTHDKTLERQNFNNATRGLFNRMLPPDISCSRYLDGFVVRIGPAYGCKGNGPLPPVAAQPTNPAPGMCASYPFAAPDWVIRAKPQISAGREKSLAAINANFALQSEDIGQAKAFLQRAVNYLGGPNDRAFADTGYLCSLGNGAIWDTGDLVERKALFRALHLGEEGLRALSLGEVKAAAGEALTEIRYAHSMAMR